MYKSKDHRGCLVLQHMHWGLFAAAVDRSGCEQNHLCRQDSTQSHEVAHSLQRVYANHSGLPFIDTLERCSSQHSRCCKKSLGGCRSQRASSSIQLEQSQRRQSQEVFAWVCPSVQPWRLPLELRPVSFRLLVEGRQVEDGSSPHVFWRVSQPRRHMPLYDWDDSSFDCCQRECWSETDPVPLNAFEY